MSEERVKVAKGKVDALRSLEALVVSDEVVEVILLLLSFLFDMVLRTKAGVRVGRRESALTASRSAMGATKRGGIRSLWFHFVPCREGGDTPTPGVLLEECGIA